MKENGTLVEGFSYNIGVGSTLEADVWGIWKGPEMAWKLGLQEGWN